MPLDKTTLERLAAEKGMTVEQLTGGPEWMDRLVQATTPCMLCAHCDTREQSVREYLKSLGITEAGETPGENTIAKDFKWADVIPRLHMLALCRIPERSGAVIVHRAATCSYWTEDRGRIWMPVTRATP